MGESDINMRLAGHIAQMNTMRNAYKILVGEPEGKRSLGRCRRRWRDNIKMGIKNVGWKVVDKIYLTQDRDWWRAVVNTVINIRAP
jgi:hypothetical protein